jgi:hypothetical protein
VSRCRSPGLLTPKQRQLTFRALRERQLLRAHLAVRSSLDRDGEREAGRAMTASYSADRSGIAPEFARECRLFLPLEPHAELHVARVYCRSATDATPALSTFLRGGNPSGLVAPSNGLGTVEQRFREWLAKQVAAHGGSQADTAADLGVDEPWLSKFLNGERKLPRMDMLERIAGSKQWHLYELVYCVEMGVLEPPPRAGTDRSPRRYR